MTTDQTKFIKNWREIEVGHMYWMIDRADPNDRDVIELSLKVGMEPSVYGFFSMQEGRYIEMRENTHVFVKIETPPTPPDELLYFGGE